MESMTRRQVSSTTRESFRYLVRFLVVFLVNKFNELKYSMTKRQVDPMTRESFHYFGTILGRFSRQQV